MPGFDTNQWAVLLLVLVLGWLLGLMSRSGDRKWRRTYERERADNLTIRAAHDADLARANARIAELERAAPATAPAPAAAAVGPAGAAGGDDLSLIRGIGRDGAPRLNEIGITSYQDLTRMSAADEAALENRVGLDPGTVARERWREQADLLATGRHDDHRRQYT